MIVAYKCVERSGRLHMKTYERKRIIPNSHTYGRWTKQHRALNQKLIYLLRHALGFCYWCWNKADKGNSLCWKHRLIRARHQRLRRARKKEYFVYVD